MIKDNLPYHEDEDELDTTVDEKTGVRTSSWCQSEYGNALKDNNENNEEDLIDILNTEERISGLDGTTHKNLIDRRSSCDENEYQNGYCTDMKRRRLDAGNKDQVALQRMRLGEQTLQCEKSQNHMLLLDDIMTKKTTKEPSEYTNKTNAMNIDHMKGSSFEEGCNSGSMIGDLKSTGESRKTNRMGTIVADSEERKKKSSVLDSLLRISRIDVVLPAPVWHVEEHSDSSFPSKHVSNDACL